MSESHYDLFGERASELFRKLISLGALACVLCGGAALRGESWGQSTAPLSALIAPINDSATMIDDVFAGHHILRHVEAEIDIAKRLLNEFKMDLRPEMDTYLDNIECILNRFSTLTSLEQAEALGNSLLRARTRFAADATDLSFWMRLARSVEPERSTFYVPERFVVMGPKENEPDLTPCASRWSVRKAVLELYADDADPSSTSI